MESQKHQEDDLVMEKILIDLLVAISHRLYRQQQQEKILENNAWSAQIQQEELKRELFPDTNVLNVTSDFVLLVVFAIIIC
jgi:hypothetical protein